MLRIIGVSLVSSMIVFYGFSASKKYIKRIKILESMVLVVDFIANQIRYLGSTVDNIIDNVSKNENYKELYFLKNIRCLDNYGEHPKYNESLPLTTSNYEHISSFISQLGFDDVEGEISRCELYKDIFSDDLKKAKLDFNNKGKLYKSMSLLTAIAIFIIFI